MNVVVGNPTTSVPDAGATIVLLGVGLLGMAILRRRV
ncbi:MAG: VPDSG-CTERM sorting domain-containing protein [Opitutaceae bacterium]|nr:VPDSG-CTERM sorting domain-containing protein [Opitutaceae bacterium]